MVSKSRIKEPGSEAVLAETPWGPLGMSVCYDVRFPQLYHGLAQAGHTPTRVHTTARVHLGPDPDGGFHISAIELHAEAEVPGIEDAAFQEQAEAAKKGCPVSKLFTGAEITLNARLIWKK